MIYSLLLVILLIIVAEAVTEIITSSSLVEPLQTQWRIWTYPTDRPGEGVIHQIMVFVDRLWNCGYCASVWISALAAIASPRVFDNIIVNWVAMTFVIHRGANWLHVLYELVRRGRVRTHEISLNITEAEEDGTT